ncbi:DciA family protein [Candidatus Neomarinimicrobiota bacterium]
MQSLKIAIDSMLRKFGIDNAIAQNNALNIWNEIVGETVAKNTEPDRVEHGVIIIKVSSPTWRQELYFQKKEIIQKINNKIGKNVIRDIRFI